MHPVSNYQHSATLVFKCKIHLRYWREMTVEPRTATAQLTVRRLRQPAVHRLWRARGKPRQDQEETPGEQPTTRLQRVCQLTCLTTARAAWDCDFSHTLKRGPLGPSPPPSCAFWYPARDHTRQRSPTCQQGVLAHVSGIQIRRRCCSRDEGAGETRDSILPSLCLSSAFRACGPLLSERPPPQPAGQQSSARLRKGCSRSPSAARA